MTHTRRQFVKSAAAGAAMVMAGNALADAPKAKASESKKTNTDAGYQTIQVDGKDMRVFVARPKNLTARIPGILVLQEAFGVNAHIRDVTQRIAALGYVAAAPELFHRSQPGFEGDYENFATSKPHMDAVTVEGLEADLKATHAWLQKDKDVKAEAIASIGYCMGGRASFVANAVLPLKAAVSYYGGGIAPALLPKAADQHAPILLFWGGKDGHITPEQHYAVAGALREAGKVFADVEFSDADHGFFCDARKSYHSVAAEESWSLVQTFFKKYLEA